MASLEDALQALVVGDSGISAVIGTRCYPSVIPESASLPAIAYQRIDANRPLTHNGPSGLSKPRIQFDFVAKTYKEGENLGALLRGLLNGYTGTVNGVEIEFISLETDEFVYGRTGKNYQFMQDYLIMHKES